MLVKKKEKKKKTQHNHTLKPSCYDTPGYKNQHMQKRSCTTLDRGASSSTQPCGRLSWTQWQSSTLHLESRELFFPYNLVTSMAIYLATAHLIDNVCLYDFCQVNFKGDFVFFFCCFFLFPAVIPFPVSASTSTNQHLTNVQRHLRQASCWWDFGGLKISMFTTPHRQLHLQVYSVQL